MDPERPIAKSSDDRELGSIEVTVTDDAGQPVVGAQLRAQRVVERDRWKPLSSGVTKPDGRAKLTQIPLGLVRIVADTDELAPEASDVINLTVDELEGAVEIALSAGGAAEGQLMDLHGEPAGGIGISVHLRAWRDTIGRNRPGILQTADTDDDGRFRFEHLTPGLHTLHTRPEGERLQDAPAQRVELEVFSGQTTVVEFEDSSASYVKLTGTIIRNGEPFSNASVNIAWADRGRGYLREKAKADDFGQFKITLREGGAYLFQIRGPGGGGSMFRTISIPAERAHKVRIAFNTGSLLGRLVGPDGEPAVGLEVKASGRSETPQVGSWLSFARSDEAGAFEFPLVPGGTYTLTAAVKGMHNPEPMSAPDLPYLGRAEIKDLLLVPGQTVSGVKLTLRSAAAVGGQVTDGSGSPAGSATIDCRPAGSRGGRGPSSWIADPSGIYLAGGLEAGEYQIRATRQREISAWVPVTARLNRTAREDLVLLPGTMVTLEASADDEPLARFYARIHDTEGVVAISTVVLKKGSAQLGPLYPGTYKAVISLSGEHGRMAQRTFTVAGEDSVTLQVELP